VSAIFPAGCSITLINPSDLSLNGTTAIVDDTRIPKPIATPYTTCGETRCSRVFASESDAATTDTRPSSTTPYATIGY
jgi:hypothetical protein